MTETSTAYALTVALLPLLDGWTWSPRTVTAIREGDPDARRWIDLVHPAYPLATLAVQTVSHQPGRVVISARYPEHYRPWINGETRYNEQITAKITKAPAIIARDIQRRLFETTGYLTWCAEAAVKKAASEAAQATAATLARDLAAQVGTVTEYDRFQWMHETGFDGYGGSRGRCGHLLTDENARKFTARGDSRSRVDAEVSYDGAHVNLSFATLDPFVAAQLLAVWRATVTEIAPQPPTGRADDGILAAIAEGGQG